MTNHWALPGSPTVATIGELPGSVKVTVVPTSCSAVSRESFIGAEHQEGLVGMGRIVRCGLGSVHTGWKIVGQRDVIHGDVLGS